MLLTLLGNGSYAFVSLQWVVAGQLAFLVVVCAVLLAHDATLQTVGGFVAAALCAYALRALVDLGMAWAHVRGAELVGPLSRLLNKTAPPLGALMVDAKERLPQLKLDDLKRRVALGFKRVEGASVFVPRNMMCMCRIGEIQHEPMLVVAYRTMTVKRYVTLSAGTPTRDKLRSPVVPMWDRELFPLRVPEGFVDRDDALTLSDLWDVVKTCWRCGGNGRIIVQVVHYRMERRYVNGQWQTVQVPYWVPTPQMCPSCLGQCRLRYQQVLHTDWRRLVATVTSPPLGTPEFAAEAEEVILYRRRLVEDFRADSASPSVISASLSGAATLSQWDASLSQSNESAHEEVEAATESLVFRAEIEVGAFHAIAMRFEHMGERLGWFFGQRPQFYMPRLPLAYSVVLACVLVAPISLGLLAVLPLVLSGWTFAEWP